MLTTLVLINSLLADPEWNLYRSVFPDDADSAIMALGPPAFAECLDTALWVCEDLGGRSVCSFCFIAQPDGTVVCSFICGNPSVPNGCTPPPPCPPWPPETEVGTEPPVSVEPED